MATIAIELTNNDVQGLCQRYWSELNTEENMTKDKAHQKAAKVLSYVLKPVSETPSGFLSFQYFLHVKLLKTDENGQEVNENLRFFAKLAPFENESRMHYLTEFGVFLKEIRFYRDVIPRIENIFPGITPKCFYAANNMLIFEDLNLQAYKMAADRTGLLDYKHLRCALRTLAALHAGSIVYEFRTGQKLNAQFPTALKENAYPLNLPKDHIRLQNFNKATEVMLEIIKVLPKYQKELPHILQQTPKSMVRIFNLAQTSEKYFNMLSHGDMWANNLMFQYEPENAEPKQCRFVDFQLARYAPPVLDVVTVLTIPTSRSFRAQYLQQLLDDYYRFMRELLQSSGLDISNYLPKSEFEQSFHEFRICGLIESILFSHLTILPPESVQNLTGSTSGFEDFFDKKRKEICMNAFNTDQIYRERLTDMIEDFVDNFVLK